MSTASEVIKGRLMDGRDIHMPSGRRLAILRREEEIHGFRRSKEEVVYRKVFEGDVEKGEVSA